MFFGKLFGKKPKEEPAKREDTPQAEVPKHIQFIGSCLGHAKKIGEDCGVTLDYTPASIPAVSRILDGYHRRYLHPEEDGGAMQEKVNAFASVFGVYIGETLLRTHPESGYGWAEKEDFGLVVAKEGGYHIDAIAKATKQIVNGRENGDEVVSFFDVAGQVMEGKLDLSKKE